MDLSIIVTCYNFEKYIAQSINSLLKATEGLNAEIIIIDDVSTDKSPEILKSIHSEKIKLILHEVNSGPRNSINEAFSIAKGKYICRFDGDDAWHKDFFTETIKILDEHPEVGLVYTDISIIGTHNEVTSESKNIKRPTQLSNPDFEFLEIFKRYYIAAPSIIARREAWDLGLPVPLPYNALDWYLSLKMSEKWKFYFINKPLASYRVHGTNMHTSQIVNKKEEEITKALFKDILDHAKIDIKSKNKIKSAAYLILAEKYFELNMFKDARRSYLSAIKFSASELTLNHYKHFLGTLLGNYIYNRIKRLI